ncbi:MAG TPA: DUF2071 domain-containing protein [Gaiellaceae bacterium]|nr:DUF2071 domain-containing protein [Gaiellaceae bacterium]
MRIRLNVRNLLLASWETDRESVERAAPPGAEPAEVDGRYLVSVVSFQVRGGRVGRLPVLPFSQLNLRTYVVWKGEPAVLFRASRVTPGGLPGLLLGAPYRSARVRARRGELRASGLGVDIRYEPGGSADPGELGRHELGIFESGGLRAIRITRGPAEWTGAELLAPAKAHMLLGYGFAPGGEPDLVYTPETWFETEPARKLA